MILSQFEASIPDFMKELKVQRFLLKTFNPELVNELDPTKKGEKQADKFDEIVIGLGIHGMATELVTVLDDCEKMVRNGEEIVKKNFSHTDLQVRIVKTFKVKFQFFHCRNLKSSPKWNECIGWLVQR
jgi:phospholipid N-methyltransferase